MGLMEDDAMNKKEHNGWYNYETWLAGLWIDNSDSEWMTDRAQLAYDEAEKDDTFTREENAAFALADEMKTTFEDESPADVTGFYADLINAALSEINWHEIAEHYINEVEKEEADQPTDSTKE